jgi:hypothetical protein
MTILHEDGEFEYVRHQESWTGLTVFDVEALCAHFGYEAVFP